MTGLLRLKIRGILSRQLPKIVEVLLKIVNPGAKIRQTQSYLGGLFVKLLMGKLLQV
jgi:hypothetical protein